VLVVAEFALSVALAVLGAVVFFVFAMPVEAALSMLLFFPSY
jgi:hypothetical protein